MNQPNDCPRFVSEVEHVRVVCDLIAQVQTLRASALVTTAAYEDWKKEAAAKLAAAVYQRDEFGVKARELQHDVEALRAELAIAVNTRDHLTNELWRAKKERDGFEKAWNLACRERAEFERERNDARDGRYALSVSCDKARATNSTVLEDRARLQAELDQATKQRREFEAAWDQARVERDTFEKEYTGAIDQNTHLRKLFVTMHELLKQGGAA
jgi:chromosome segregation ATPase